MRTENAEVANPGRRRWKWPVAAVAIAALTISYWQSVAQDLTSVTDEIPACDRSAVTRLVKTAITGSPVAKSYNVGVFGVLFISEYPSSSAEKRVCFGTIFTNSGNYDIIYFVGRTEAAKELIGLHLEILPKNYL